MDLKSTEDELNKVDSLLTTLKKILKKHWGILLTIVIIYGIYWIWNLPDELVTDETTTEQVTDEQPVKGDTIWTNDTTYYIQD